MGMALGVVEGFYGPPWTWEQRRSTLTFLASEGFGVYLYAPKGDPHLRKRWREPHPDGVATELRALSRAAREAGIAFGLGLSPFALHDDLARGRGDLVRRARDLAALEPALVAVLFDDMNGATPELAATQAEIVHLVAAEVGGAKVATCPTYYTTAPILDRLFGARPPSYLDDLGRALDPAVDILWTGPEVCSARYPAAHLDQVAGELRRPPLLWDNYPVNDGPRMCKRLHLRPFTGRSEVVGHARGLLANPMNQCAASWPVLATLRDDLAGRSPPARAASPWLSPALAALLDRDADRFQDEGLDAIPGPERSRLGAEYRGVGHPAGAEIAAWLDGAYVVGSECLTD